MQVSLKVSGGFAGLRPPATVVDAGALGPAERNELAALVARACADGGGPRAASRVPDAMSFVVVVDDGGKQTVLHGSERAMGASLAALVGWLRAHRGTTGTQP